MTFYPDGETPIPNQTPIPDGRPPSPEQPSQTGRPEGSSRLSKVITRTSIINGVILVVAVVLAYVVPVSEDPSIAIAIVVGAAVLCAVHLTVMLMREMRRRQHALGTIPASVPPPVTSQPYASTPSATAQPYGAVPAGTQGQLLVEDVFTITGRGTVATGKVVAGELWVGQRAQVIREGALVAQTEIAGLEQFRSTTEVAAVGDAVGVLLTGVARSDVQRGDVIAT